MQTNVNYPHSRNRILILTYITLLTLSLAPATTPPERGFDQGQQEMELAMDNMVTHKPILTKRKNTAPIEDKDWHSVLTSKTSNLLTEAEQVLKSLPGVKDRHWVESFVQRMRAIAKMLERTTQNKNMPNDLNSVSGTPVPEGLPLQPTWPTTPAVPGINPFQKMNKMVSKFPMTSPELSKVLPDNEYPSEHQAVTKPAVSTSNNIDEEDELVKELESLHQEKAQEVPFSVTKILVRTPVLTTPSTLASLESSSLQNTDEESIKAKLQAKLIKEMTEFQHLGGRPNDVIDALHIHGQETPGFEDNQKSNLEEKMKFTDVGMVDKHGIQKISSLHDDEEISRGNQQNSILKKSSPSQEGQLYQVNSNQSIQIVLPHRPNLQTYPKHFGSQFPYVHLFPSHNAPYQESLQNPYIQEKHPNKILTTNQQIYHVPDALKQMLSRPRLNYYNGNMPSAHNGLTMRPNYGPNPYSPNWNPKNSTSNLPHMIPLYQPRQIVNHQIDTQLSDEMKRQLRDGKIIMLSDSVVHSNFDLNNGGTTTGDPTNPTEKIKMASEN